MDSVPAAAEWLPPPACDIVGTGDLQLDFRNHVGGVFGTAIHFGLTFLPSEALDLGNGHARDTGFGQRIANLIEFERFDYGNDIFHQTPLIVFRV